MNSRLRMQLYRTTHLWHWISAAVCFAALALFTITGITLNHARHQRPAGRDDSQRAAAGDRCAPRLRTGGAGGAACRNRSARGSARNFGICRCAARSGVVGRGALSIGAGTGPRRLGVHRSRERRREIRIHRSRLGLLFQRPAQGPQYRHRLDDVHRRRRGRRAVLLDHRPGAAVDPGAAAHVHMAAGRSAASCSSSRS